MSKNNLVERQKTANAKRQKLKVVKWVYVTEPFDVKVLPALFKRLHSPLTPWLSSLTENCYVHLRPCLQGVDEDGAVVKYLYCTRDGRFFVRRKDGWIEIKTDCRGNNPKSKGGSTDCPQLRRYDHKPAHRCVAVAWCNPPKYVKEFINNKYAKRIYEVDHVNGDHKNWTADNLQWVTSAENYRRGKITRLMRRIALDPKWLTRTLLLGVFTMPDHLVIFCLNTFKRYSKKDPSPLSVDAIRHDFAKALDDTREEAKNWKSVPAYKLMTLGRVSHIKNKICKRFYIIRKNHA